MPDPLASKLDTLFKELVGARASALSADIPRDACGAITAALGDFPAKTVADIAFHMTGWNRDAAFVVALLLSPGRFTPKRFVRGCATF